MGNPHNKKSNKKKCKEPGKKNKPTQKRTQEKEHVSGAEVQKGDVVRKQKFYEDFVDFYEGAGLGPIQQRIFCTTVLADYEQTFKTIGKITKEMVDFRKYEVYVMLYPTLAIAYLQMVWSGKLQRAISFVGRNKHELDDSYKRRIEKLKLIRKPLDVPQRALELLSGADKVKFCMLTSTFNQFKELECQLSPSGHLKRFLDHFEILTYADDKIPQEQTLRDRPLPAPFAWASRDVIPDCPFNRKNLPSIIMNNAIPSPNDNVTCATYSADHCTVAFGTSSGRVHVVAVNKDWQDVNSLQRETLISAHQKPVLACAFSPGDSHLLTSSADRTMRLWCTRTALCKTVYVHHGALCLAFAPRGCHFATASNDNVARVWGVDSTEPLFEFLGHLARLEICLFHPNGEYLATGSADATVRIWDYDTRAQMRLFRGHRAPIKALAYSVCGRFLVSGGRDDLIIVWDTTNERMLHCMIWHNAMIESIGFSHCNNLMVVWGKDCHLSTFDFQLLVRSPEMELSSTKAIIDQSLISTVQSPRNRIFLKSGFVDRNRLVAICKINS
ncbi:transcription initiation factor TFIID subunit 5-like isoform X1 [Drosophila miranda]|uniref:transcription initiation factor TFIID subunit 5-like isoform X1 n=1 Tax=Drosophila miranda TaxID=7229 RepID=UPI00143F7818|nr:transcription initiation factor TFIID subunit 5-like isoform X1 [Drosophila miranda]